MLQCWKAAIFADGAVKAYWQSMAWHGHVVDKDGNEKGGRWLMGLAYAEVCHRARVRT
jgi:hypothetical protein